MSLRQKPTQKSSSRIVHEPASEQEQNNILSFDALKDKIMAVASGHNHRLESSLTLPQQARMRCEQGSLEPPVQRTVELAAAQKGRAILRHYRMPRILHTDQTHHKAFPDGEHGQRGLRAYCTNAISSGSASICQVGIG